MNEILQYRELLKNLTITELKLRYQNTALGFLWSLLSPLFMALVLYFVFRYLWRQEHNFPAYLLVGLMSWRFFSISTTSAVYSIVGRSNLVTKVYVPRKILVLSNSLANLFSSMIEFIIIIPLIYLVMGQLPFTIIFFPLVFVIYFWFIYGASLFLASLFVSFRDVNQIWEVLSGTLFFLSPVFYPMIAITDRVMPYYLLNPLTDFIIMYRDLMIYGTMPTAYNLAVAGFATVVVYIVGNFTFDRLQRRFAEEL